MTDIFTFGSNLRGAHGKGAALEAIQKYGAIYGQGVGLQGQSYAIPTKDERLYPLALPHINEFVTLFKTFANLHQEVFRFNVTRIGCGLAGYRDQQIAPMFVGSPSNCLFSDEWKSYLL